MKDKEFVRELVDRGSKANDGYFHYAHLVAVELPSNLHEQLEQIVNGPVWDGDVISKSLRGELFEYGLVQRVCVKGGQGYTGATYFAHTVLEAITDIKEGRIGA